MGIRATLTSTGVAAVLALTGCGLAGSIPGEVDDDAPDRIDTLSTKLDALRNDACHTQPAEQEPRACEKFVTQLGNAANTLDQAAQQGHEELAEPAERMSSHVAQYRDNRCATTDPTSQEQCVTALTTLADEVDEVRADLNER